MLSGADLRVQGGRPPPNFSSRLSATRTPARACGASHGMRLHRAASPLLTLDVAVGGGCSTDAHAILASRSCATSRQVSRAPRRLTRNGRSATLTGDTVRAQIYQTDTPRGILPRFLVACRFELRCEYSDTTPWISRALSMSDESLTPPQQQLVHTSHAAFRRRMPTRTVTAGES